jgi:hypothetical protein
VLLVFKVWQAPKVHKADRVYKEHKVLEHKVLLVFQALKVYKVHKADREHKAHKAH